MYRPTQRLRMLASVAVTAAVAWPSGVIRAQAPDDPWADEVIEYIATDPVAGFTDPALSLGPPLGIDPSVPVNTGNVVSLGTPLGDPRGHLTLKFNSPVTDDPQNPLGLDFIVFSNAFWVVGDSQRRFQEPALVEISDDGVNWALIPGARGLSYNAGELPVIAEADGADNESDSSILAGVVRNPNLFDLDPGNDEIEANWGYAEMSPTPAPFLDNFLRPDDPFTVGITPRSGGGDAFDIAWAIDQAGGTANLAQFRYIRITPFIDRLLTGLGAATPEIAAVADVPPDIDTDGDGIIDEYESRVIATDPLRPENTLLPLEIPALEGGSPPGTLLGMAQHPKGHALRLYADQSRTDPVLHTVVDLVETTAPPGPLSEGGFIKSGAVVRIDSTEPDFVAAQIEPGEVTVHYLPLDIAAVNETALEPFRFNGTAYDQNGISTVQRDAAANTVTFRTGESGLFLLAAPSGSGEPGSAHVWVDFSHTGIENGTVDEPFASFAQAEIAVSAGGTVHFAAGESGETPQISRAMTLVADSGPVRIGVPTKKFSLRPRGEATTGFQSRTRK